MDVTAVTKNFGCVCYRFAFIPEISMDGYKDLSVWRESVLFIPTVYALAPRFPEEERLVLWAEIRTAAVAVPSKIAEGESQSSRREFMRLLSAARGSLSRLHVLLTVAEQLGYITPPELETLEVGIGAIARPLHGLIAKIHRDIAEKRF
jgi:four helix bundle protein